MHESVVLALSLPDGRRVLQRRDTDAPSARGMLAFFGGGVEDSDFCRHEGAVREQLEELDAPVTINYLGYFFYISQKYDKPIVRISVYSGELETLPIVTEGSLEAHELHTLKGRPDLATSAEAIITKMESNTWH